MNNYIIRFSLMALVVIFWNASSLEAKRYFYSYNEMQSLLKENQRNALQKITVDLDALSHPLRIKRQNAHSPFLYKEIAFTFDLGAKPGHIDEILGALKKHGFKATFFITGNFVKKYPDKTLKIVDDGHEVGNHTFYHPKMRSRAQLYRELTSTETIFYKLTRRYLVPYWRSPYFQVRFQRYYWQLKAAEQMGYKHFHGNIFTNDWTPERNPYFVTGNQFYQGFQGINLKGGKTFFSFHPYRVKHQTNPARFDVRGAIVVMHAYSHRRSNFLALQLDKIFSFLKTKGYKVVTLSELMNDHDSSNP